MFVWAWHLIKGERKREWESSEVLQGTGTPSRFPPSGQTGAIIADDDVSSLWLESSLLSLLPPLMTYEDHTQQESSVGPCHWLHCSAAAVSSDCRVLPCRSPWPITIASPRRPWWRVCLAGSLWSVSDLWKKITMVVSGDCKVVPDRTTQFPSLVVL